MAKADRVIGFIGLGQMGGPMAANIAKGGHKLICYDAAGTEALMPEGATACGSVADVVKGADTIFLSLPNGAIMESVAAEIADVDSARACCFQKQPRLVSAGQYYPKPDTRF